MPAPSAAPPSPVAIPPHAVMQQAAQWFAILSSGSATERDRMRWQAWLAASATHQQAWRYVDAVSQDVAQLQASANPEVLSHQMIGVQTRMHRRRTLLGLAALLGLGGISWATWRYAGVQGMLMAWQADYHTSTGVVESIVLPDGGQLWLNTASAVNVDYGIELRRIALLRGELWVATQQDPAERPFVVDTVHGRMQALGTRFSVQLLEGTTQLTVFEGAVQIQPADTGKAQALIVQSGEQAEFDAQRILSHGAALPGSDSWMRGVLQANQLSLADLLVQLRRYYRGHIGLADEVAHLQVVGSFQLDDIPRALQVLEVALPVRVSRTLPWWISIDPV